VYVQCVGASSNAQQAASSRQQAVRLGAAWLLLVILVSLLVLLHVYCQFIVLSRSALTA
jgi:hypothetical protein